MNVGAAFFVIGLLYGVIKVNILINDYQILAVSLMIEQMNILCNFHSVFVNLET